MKNAALMKLLKEEKLGLKIDRIIINIFFLLSFFSSSLSFSQIPINGFCGLKDFQVKPNQTKIFPIDINKDGWRDFISFNQQEKNYSVISWENNKYIPAVTKSFPTSLFDLHITGADDSRGKKYAYISRKDREAGFISFSRSGSISLLTKIKFDSYPSSIDVSNINKNGKSVILVSGYNFNGLSILSEEKSKLNEKIIDNNIYSYSRFIDLDYDGYNDIVAVDLFRNSIVLFNNDRSGNFYLARSIALKGERGEVSVSDFNSDGYSDLIFTSNNGFEFFPGDSVSSFNKTITIKTPEKPDKYTILDFNGDGYNDIAYINKESGRLFVSFAKNTNEFYSPIIYLERKGIIDLVSFIDRSGKKIAVLDSNQKLYIIEKTSNLDNASIALALQKGIVGTFSLSNSKTKGLFIIDNTQFKIHFLISRKGIFDTYYNSNLSGRYSNIVIDEINRENKTFYFYNKGENVIELLRFNFTRSVSSKRILYASGQIHDLKITSDRVKDIQSIYVLNENKGKLYIEAFDFRDFRYLSSGAEVIYSGIDNASLAFDLYKEIFFVTKSGKNILLKKSVFNRKVQSEETLLSIPSTDNEKIFSDIVSFDDESISQNVTASWFSYSNVTDLYLYIRKKLIKIGLKNFSPSIGTMRYLDGEDENSLFLYDSNKRILKRVDISSQGKILNVSDIFESKSINSYIVDRLIGKKEFLIYSDDNLVTIQIVK